MERRETERAIETPLTLGITVGVDGLIYCHDIPVELLPVLEELCPDDPQLRSRRALQEAMERKGR